MASVSVAVDSIDSVQSFLLELLCGQTCILFDSFIHGGPNLVEKTRLKPEREKRKTSKLHSSNMKMNGTCCYEIGDLDYCSDFVSTRIQAVRV